MRLKGVELRRRLRIPTRFLALGERPAAAGAEAGRLILFDGVWDGVDETRLEGVVEALVEDITFRANGTGLMDLEGAKSSSSVRFRLERPLRAEGSMFSES